MKKHIYLFLVMAMVLLMPFTANAAGLKPHIPTEDEEKPVTVKNSDGTITKTFNVYVTVSEENLTSVSADFSFTFGNAVKGFSCGDPSTKRFVAQTNTADRMCTFAAPEGEKITGKVKAGTISITVDPKGEDCSITYMLDGVSGKVNPNTGANVPYLYVIGGLVLAAGIYFATSKKTKFHRI